MIGANSAERARSEREHAEGLVGDARVVQDRDQRAHRRRREDESDQQVGDLQAVVGQDRADQRAAPNEMNHDTVARVKGAPRTRRKSIS